MLYIKMEMINVVNGLLKKYNQSYLMQYNRTETISSPTKDLHSYELSIE